MRGSRAHLDGHTGGPIRGARALRTTPSLEVSHAATPWLLAFAGVTAPVLASLACTSSSSVPGADSGAPGSDAALPPSGEAGALAVTPASANVLTCSSLQLAETGGSGGGAWSVSPGTGFGAVSATGQFSAASTATDSDAGVTVTYAEGAASASAKTTSRRRFQGALVPSR